MILTFLLWVACISIPILGLGLLLTSLDYFDHKWSQYSPRLGWFFVSLAVACILVFYHLIASVWPAYDSQRQDLLLEYVNQYADEEEDKYALHDWGYASSWGMFRKPADPRKFCLISFTRIWTDSLRVDKEQCGEDEYIEPIDDDSDSDDRPILTTRRGGS